MGEEHSDSILTFKFNYDVLFLTTKMLQILWYLSEVRAETSPDLKSLSLLLLSWQFWTWHGPPVVLAVFQRQVSERLLGT